MFSSKKSRPSRSSCQRQRSVACMRRVEKRGRGCCQHIAHPAPTQSTYFSCRQAAPSELVPRAQERVLDLQSLRTKSGFKHCGGEYLGGCRLGAYEAASALPRYDRSGTAHLAARESQRGRFLRLPTMSCSTHMQAREPWRAHHRPLPPGPVSHPGIQAMVHRSGPGNIVFADVPNVRTSSAVDGGICDHMSPALP